MGKCQICNSRKGWEHGRGKKLNPKRIALIKWSKPKHLILKLHLVETNSTTTTRISWDEKQIRNRRLTKPTSSNPNGPKPKATLIVDATAGRKPSVTKQLNPKSKRTWTLNLSIGYSTITLVCLAGQSEATNGIRTS